MSRGDFVLVNMLNLDSHSKLFSFAQEAASQLRASNENFLVNLVVNGNFDNNPSLLKPSEILRRKLENYIRFIVGVPLRRASSVSDASDEIVHQDYDIMKLMLYAIGEIAKNENSQGSVDKNAKVMLYNHDDKMQNFYVTETIDKKTVLLE